jgi:hypothetical protein
MACPGLLTFQFVVVKDISCSISGNSIAQLYHSENVSGSVKLSS